MKKNFLRLITAVVDSLIDFVRPGQQSLRPIITSGLLLLTGLALTGCLNLYGNPSRTTAKSAKPLTGSESGQAAQSGNQPEEVPTLQSCETIVQAIRHHLIDWQVVGHRVRPGDTILVFKKPDTGSGAVYREVVFTGNIALAEYALTQGWQQVPPGACMTDNGPRVILFSDTVIKEKV